MSTAGVTARAASARNTWGLFLRDRQGRRTLWRRCQHVTVKDAGDLDRRQTTAKVFLCRLVCALRPPDGRWYPSQENRLAVCRGC